jgi:hypothetical protein
VFSSNTESKTKETQDGKIESLQRSIRDAERWMIWLTGALAFFALCSVIVGLLQWCSTKGQLNIASGQLEQMKTSSVQIDAIIKEASKQAAATNRLANEAKRATDIAQSQQASPWVGIEQDSFTVGSPQYAWNQAPPSTRPTISFPVNFRMKNFGSAPALHVHPGVTVVAIRHPIFGSEQEFVEVVN